MRVLLSSQEELDSSINKTYVEKQIKKWIDENTYSLDFSLIWHIGIANSENLKSIESIIRNDITCKHMKSWRTDSLRMAMDIVRDLNKSTRIFKSCHNKYSSHGLFVFTYKTTIPKNSFLYHTLHNDKISK
jgi:hypothetical protein